MASREAMAVKAMHASGVNSGNSLVLNYVKKRRPKSILQEWNLLSDIKPELIHPYNGISRCYISEIIEQKEENLIYYQLRGGEGSSIL